MLGIIFSYTFGALMSIHTSRMVYVFVIIMKEHIIQCNSLAQWYVFNSFQTTMALYGTEKYAISCFGYIENTKKQEYNQTYVLNSWLKVSQ